MCARCCASGAHLLHANVGPAFPVELPFTRREHARQRAVLVDDAHLVLIELDDVEMTLHRRASLLQQLVDPRMLELRYAQVVQLHGYALERLQDPPHTRLENAHEAPLSPQQSTFGLRDSETRSHGRFLFRRLQNAKTPIGMPTRVLAGVLEGTHAFQHLSRKG